MSYATIDDIMKRYKPIRTIVGSEDMQVTSMDVSSIFIRDAESLVDAYLANKYTVPLSPVPSYITMVTADIAIFNILLEHLPRSPDFFQPRYDRAMGILSSVLSGTIVVTSAAILTTGDQEAWSTTDGYHSVFSPVLDPDEQTVDKDRVEADEDVRIGDLGAISNC
jgi:phage gp36-like protein